jgi:DnaJ-class molecular chaperone
MDIFKQNQGNNSGPFGPGFPFGPGGPFGQGFPFGPGGPFEKRFPFGPGGPFGAVNPGNQRNKNVDPILFHLKVSLEQIYKEEKVPITFNYYHECNSCNGEGGKTDICGLCQGKGQRVQIQQMGHMISQTILNCNSCNGSGKKVINQCKICLGKGIMDEMKVFSLPLSSKFISGNKIHVQREGNRFKDIISDLIITIEIIPHPIFKRNKNNLMMSIELTLEEALFGFVKNFTFIDGITYSIQSSTKTDSYIVKAVESMGVNAEGSLCIIFIVCLPNIKIFNEKLNELKDYFKKNSQNIEKPEKLLHLSDVSNPKDVLLEFLKLN